MWKVCGDNLMRKAVLRWSPTEVYVGWKSCERRLVRPDGNPSEVRTVESLAQTQLQGSGFPATSPGYKALVCERFRGLSAK
jgi:hypothetical protein